ncbi:MAG: hypothetical protein IPG50_11880 [Myxococcales bacterium]|nr:hypothetical protein [Myxococcales bacterium]
MSTHTLAKMQAKESKIQEADTRGDVDRAFRLRAEFIYDALFTGHPEKALVTFGWLRAKKKDDPARFDDDLLWEQKLIAAQLWVFPHVPRAKIEAAIADFEAEARSHAVGERSIAKIRFLWAKHRGDEAEMAKWYETWLRARRDWLTDCLACDKDTELEEIFDRGHDAVGMVQAKPFLEGELACEEVPLRTLPLMLVPLLRLGRSDEAAALYKRNEPKLRRSRNLIRAFGRHLTYLTLIGNLKAACASFERHAEFLLTAYDADERFSFFTAARLTMKRLGDERLRLKLPEASGIVTGADGKVAAPEVYAWVDTVARSLATTFDERNGTGAYHRAIVRADALLDELGGGAGTRES